MKTLLLFVGTFTLYLIQFWFIFSYAVNIPFWDEWDLFSAAGYPGRITSDWLFQFHNEHRIVFTQLLTALMFHISHLNFVYQIVINYLIFGAVILLLARIGSQVIPNSWWWLVVCIPLSPLLAENHLWAFQSSFHFVLLFLFGGQLLLFSPESNLKREVFGLVLVVCGAYSLGAGVSAGLLTIIFYFLLQFGLFYKKKIQRELFISKSLAIVFSLIAIALYFVGFSLNPNHPPVRFPWQNGFPPFFFNLISLGFGYSNISSFTSGVCVTITFGSIALLVFQILRRLDHVNASIDPRWVLVVSQLSILTILAAITMGRAGTGIHTSKFSRYAEFSVMLVPLSIWSILSMGMSQRSRGVITFCIVLIALIGHVDELSYSRFQREKEKRIEGQNCVRGYLENQNIQLCKTIYPGAIADKIERARALNVSFVQENLPMNKNSERHNAPS